MFANLCIFTTATFLAVFTNLANASVITFEEVGDIGPSVIDVYEINSLTFSGLRVLDYVDIDKAFLVSSGRNAAYLSPRSMVSVGMKDRNPFTFESVRLARSAPGEGDFIRLQGLRDGSVVFQTNFDALITSHETPRLFEANWNDIDTLTLVWTGVGTLCCSAGYVSFDDLSVSASPVPEPNSFVSFVSGILLLVFFRKSILQSDRKDQTGGSNSFHYTQLKPNEFPERS